MPRILLVDDEPSILNVLSTLLKANGYDVAPVQNGREALDLLDREAFDLVITDLRMQPVDGMQVLRGARRVKPHVPVVLVTAFGSVENAVAAMRDGAFDYVTKPFKVDELLLTAQRAIEYAGALRENAELKARLAGGTGLEGVVAVSAPMRQVVATIERVGPTDMTVLLTGESGTGKEVIAKAIHGLSARKARRFLPINCAAMPEPLLESELFGHVKGAFTGASCEKEGLFAAAHGGTLFLDEVGAMPLSLQGKLLRVLQEHEIRKVGGTETVAVDVRVVAATNTSLESLIEQKRFREDLYYRLSVIPIELAPLRERPEDILPLAMFFLRHVSVAGPPPELSAEAEWLLEQYPWPGNVRQLENAIRHAVAFARDGRITPETLPPRVARFKPSDTGAEAEHPLSERDAFKSLRAYLREREKAYLAKVLAHTGGDKEEAARVLKISLATLYRKMPEPED